MIYCECNHSAPWHGLTELDAAKLTGGSAPARCYACSCTAFKEDPTFEPKVPRSVLTTTENHNEI